MKDDCSLTLQAERTRFIQWLRMGVIICSVENYKSSKECRVEKKEYMTQFNTEMVNRANAAQQTNQLYDVN